MNNYQWLLKMDGADRKAWFDAEHVETANGTLDGDTAAENADSRERLEADMRELMRNLYEIGYTDAKINHGILNDEVAAPLFSFDEKRGAKFIELLDRQAAITAHQWESYHNGMMREWMAKTVELQEQVDELTAERDEWKSRCEKGKAQFDAILAERELYREALSQLLDTVTDGMGKVSALLDSHDEGMA